MIPRKPISPLEDHQNLETELFMGDLTVIDPVEEEEDIEDTTFDHPNTWFI